MLNPLIFPWWNVHSRRYFGLMGGRRRVVLQRSRVCARCHVAVPGGVTVWQTRGSKILCLGCLATPTEVVPTTLNIGVPGQSAAREYHRRNQRDQAAAKRALPRQLVGVGVAAFVVYLVVQILAGLFNRSDVTPSVGVAGSTHLPFPHSSAHALGIMAAIVIGLIAASKLHSAKQSTEAWAKGSRGEKQLAAFLGRLQPKGVALIHDRRIPGTSANIDHIAVGPAGIFILDAKNLSGRVETRRSGSGRRRGPIQLFIGGRNRTRYLDGMEKQIIAVRAVLERVPNARSIPIHPMVVIMGAKWGFLAHPIKLSGVWIGWPKEANRVVGRGGPLTPDTISRVTSALAQGLPAA